MDIWKIGNNLRKFKTLEVKEEFTRISIQLNKCKRENGWKTLELYDTDFEEGTVWGDFSFLYSREYPVVNSEVKEILEASQFSKYFEFLEVTIDDKNDSKHYLVHYLNLVDGLDMNKTKYHDISGGIRIIDSPVFKESIKSSDIFKVRIDEFSAEREVFCNDNFKDFVEEHNLTGIEFKKVQSFN